MSVRFCPLWGTMGQPWRTQARLKQIVDSQYRATPDGLSDANRHVGRVTLNGRMLDRVFLRHEEIAAGGELRFTMQATPNRDWGTAKSAWPCSMSVSR